MGKSRKYNKKRSYRKKASKYTGKASNNTRTVFKAVFRTVTDAKAQQSLLPGLGSYIYYNLSPQNNTVYNITNVTEFNAQKTLYDEFKITSCTMKYRPYQNVQAANNVTNTKLLNNLYSVIDRDGNIPVSLSNNVPLKLQQYDSCKVHNFYKGFSRTMKIKGWWTDTNAGAIPNTTSSGVTQPWINAGALQCMAVYGENLNTAPLSLMGQIEISFRVQFRGKKPVDFSLDPVSGGVLLTPATSFTPLPPMNLGPVAPPDVYQTVDVSGNIVTLSSYTGDQAIASGND